MRGRMDQEAEEGGKAGASEERGHRGPGKRSMRIYRDLSKTHSLFRVTDSHRSGSPHVRHLPGPGQAIQGRDGEDPPAPQNGCRARLDAHVRRGPPRLDGGGGARRNSAGQGRRGHRGGAGRRQGREDLRLQVQAPEELSPEDGTSGEIHRGPDHRREGRVTPWHTRKASAPPRTAGPAIPSTWACRSSAGSACPPATFWSVSAAPGSMPARTSAAPTTTPSSPWWTGRSHSSGRTRGARRFPSTRSRLRAEGRASGKGNRGASKGAPFAFPDRLLPTPGSSETSECARASLIHHSQRASHVVDLRPLQRRA